MKSKLRGPSIYKAFPMVAAAVCALVVGKLFTVPNVAAQLPSIPPAFIEKWDISTANSSLTQDFVVTGYKMYRVELIFSPNSRPFDKEKFDELNQIVGDGSFEMVAGIAKEGTSRAATGIIIPIRIQLFRLNDSFPPELVVDKLIKTKGTIGSGQLNKTLLVKNTGILNVFSLGGTIRQIYQIPLHPGKYRINTTTSQPTDVPHDIETIFSVTSVANVTPS